MPEMRGEEQWVGACSASALPGVTVEQHDDGSRPGMYDLDLLRTGKPFGACEITAVADAESIESWDLINGRTGRWIEPNLLGGWIVTITPRCRAKRLLKELPGVLRTLERSEDPSQRGDAVGRLSALDVVDATRGETSFPGSIYVTRDRSSEHTGGMVADTADGLVAWFDAWVREPELVNNLEKLRKAKRLERHLFVLFRGFTTAPFSASDLLMRSDAPLPGRAVWSRCPRASHTPG